MPARRRHTVIATQVLEKARPGAPVRALQAEAGRPDFFVLLAEIGPVTAAGFAFAAGMSRYEAAGWLERNTSESFIHRDAVTGRYAAWCRWPREGAVPLRPSEFSQPRNRVRRAFSHAWEKALGFLALAWFGLMADHSLWLSDDSAYSMTAPLWRDETGQTEGERQ
jgi:hypothetical protein